MSKAKYSYKIRWGGLGVLLGIISILIAIYSIFFRIVSAELTYDILSESNVIDFNKPLEDIKIFYKDENISEKNQNLLVITLKISNSGNTDVKRSDFDEKLDWGFKITNGKIVKITPIKLSSDYVEQNFNLNLQDNQTVSFDKIFFDEGEFFVLEIFIIHNEEMHPEIIPKGKVSGIDKFKVISSWQENRIVEVKEPDETGWVDFGFMLLIASFLIMLIFKMVIRKEFINKEKGEKDY